MSRRISLLVLAASAALIATPAAADPECFGETCHLADAADPPMELAPPSGADEAIMPAANAASAEANAAAEKLAPAKALPHVIANPAKVPPPAAQAAVIPVEELPQPMARRPLPQQRTAEKLAAPSEPVRPAPRGVKDAPVLADETPPVPPASHARTARVTSAEPSYVVGYNAPPVAGVVVVVPGMAYAAGQRPVYMFAPGAKIISIDSAED